MIDKGVVAGILLWWLPKEKKACHPKCDLTYFFVQLFFYSITYRHLTNIARHKVTCLYG